MKLLFFELTAAVLALKESFFNFFYFNAFALWAFH